MIAGDARPMSLADVREGEPVQVVEVLGGHGLVGRLESMGIRPGTEIRKVSSVFMRGPVTVEVHGTRVAMGFGMARKVLVRPATRQSGQAAEGAATNRGDSR